MRKTNAQRQAELRARRRQQGLTLHQNWYKSENHAKVKEYIKKVEEEAEQ